MDSSRRRLAGDLTPSLVSRPRPRMRQHGQHVSSVSSIERAKKGAGGRRRLRENKGAFILAAIDKLRRVCVLSRESGGRLASPRAARRSSLFRRPQNDQAAPTMAFCGLKEKGLGGPTSREKRDKPKKKKKLPPWRSKMPACKPPLPFLRTTAYAPSLLFHSSHPPHDAPFQTTSIHIKINVNKNENREPKSTRPSSACSSESSCRRCSSSRHCCWSKKNAAGTSPRATRPPGGSGGSPRGPRRVSGGKKRGALGKEERERGAALGRKRERGFGKEEERQGLERENIVFPLPFRSTSTSPRNLNLHLFQENPSVARSSAPRSASSAPSRAPPRP